VSSRAAPQPRGTGRQGGRGGRRGGAGRRTERGLKIAGSPFRNCPRPNTGLGLRNRAEPVCEEATELLFTCLAGRQNTLNSSRGSKDGASTRLDIDTGRWGRARESTTASRRDRSRAGGRRTRQFGPYDQHFGPQNVFSDFQLLNGKGLDGPSTGLKGLAAKAIRDARGQRASSCHSKLILPNYQGAGNRFLFINLGYHPPPGPEFCNAV